MIYSPPDIALILGIALLVFGPKRLPELGNAIGQGIGNFKKSMSEAESAIRTGVSSAASVPVGRAPAEPMPSIASNTATSVPANPIGSIPDGPVAPAPPPLTGA